jgi:hypothetical protein
MYLMNKARGLPINALAMTMRWRCPPDRLAPRSHGENANVRLGIALPEGFATYNNLIPRIKWFKESLSFTVYWVAEDAIVREE